MAGKTLYEESFARPAPVVLATEAVPVARRGLAAGGSGGRDSVQCWCQARLALCPGWHYGQPGQFSVCGQPGRRGRHLVQWGVARLARGGEGHLLLPYFLLYII